MRPARGRRTDPEGACDSGHWDADASAGAPGRGRKDPQRRL